MALAKYIGRKVAWTLVVFFVALLLNFLLPRLIPGNPVDAIVGQLAQGGGAGGEQLQQIHEQYMKEFGLDKPLWQQFFIYIGNVFQGDLGTSFAQYPASVNTLIAQALPWSLAIMLPAILIGWLVGNLLGAVAAFKGGWLDRGAFIGSLFLSSVPPFALAIILLFVVAVKGGILPVGGAYSFGLTPEFSLAFFGDAITYWWLPFWSLVLVFIGGQAVGMRSMAIYELGSDYVNYNRGLGVQGGPHGPLHLPQCHAAAVHGPGAGHCRPHHRRPDHRAGVFLPRPRQPVVRRHRPERLPGDFGDHSADHDRRAHCQPCR